MTVKRDPDAILAAWLEEGPTALPEPTRRAISANTRSNHQSRRPIWASWRTPMNSLARMTVAAVAVVIAVGGALYLFGPSRPGNGAAPTAATSPTPSATSRPPQASDLMVTYTSRRYGYSIDIPETWSVTPATAPWSGAFQIGEDPQDADSFLAKGSSDDASVAIKAHALPAGTTAGAWLSSWERAFEVGGHCFGSAIPWADARVAGVPARRLQWRCDSPRDSKSNYDVYSLVSGSTAYVISGTPSMVDLVLSSFRAP